MEQDVDIYTKNRTDFSKVAPMPDNTIQTWRNYLENYVFDGYDKDPDCIIRYSMSDGPDILYVYVSKMDEIMLVKLADFMYWVRTGQNENNFIDREMFIEGHRQDIDDFSIDDYSWVRIMFDEF